MQLYTILILAFGMSMDAFAAAIGKGASLHRPPLKEALRTGLIFGVIEAITPVIGWGIGLAASQFIMSWDHWVAFTLLLILGIRMIAEAFRKDKLEEDTQAPRRHGFWVLVTADVATSLDAMAVGVGLAFLQVNILVMALTIGAATTIMATSGMLLGRFLGAAMGKWAEILGGVVLIGIGTSILIEHLGLLG
ncbi:manganese efflux pump MntP [Rahnella aceris]